MAPTERAEGRLPKALGPASGAGYGPTLLVDGDEGRRVAAAGGERRGQAMEFGGIANVVPEKSTTPPARPSRTIPAACDGDVTAVGSAPSKLIRIIRPIRAERRAARSRKPVAGAGVGESIAAYQRAGGRDAASDRRPAGRVATGAASSAAAAADPQSSENQEKSGEAHELTSPRRGISDRPLSRLDCGLSQGTSMVQQTAAREGMGAGEPGTTKGRPKCFPPRNGGAMQPPP